MPLAFQERSLPSPDPDALAHSRKVAAYISQHIKMAENFLPFDAYMQYALYAENLGYYRSGTTKFGAAGDFVTAPELSPLFAQTIAEQCAQTLQDCDGEAILELGAGTGQLALGILQSLPTLPKRYLILEVSGELRARQRQTLSQVPDALERVQWLDHLPEKPVRGAILANEVLDALPVRRFRYRADEVDEMGVTMSEKGFRWRARPADASLAKTVRVLAQRYRWPSRYLSELSPQLNGLIASLSRHLHCGNILLFDYGLPEHEYYHPQRYNGTLICHYRHRTHEDPFRWPGLTDITAWVNFSAAAEAAEDADLEVSGYTTQAHFLLGAGILDKLAAVKDAPERLRRTHEVQRLTLPGEMGEAFKVMCLSRQCPAPSGFAFRDLRSRL